MTRPQRILYIHSDGKARRRLPLPLKTRARLRIVRWINTVCCWLCDHGRDGMAELIWRACGMWP